MINNPNETNCSYCIKKMNKLFSYYKESADESSKYTSFVFSLGYVTMVTIFSTIHKYMYNWTKGLFIICLFISLGIFITNEIWKMYLGISFNKFVDEQWDRQFNGEINLEQLEANINKYNNKLFKPYNKFYYPTFWISVITGIFAVLIIFFVGIYLVF